MMKNSLTMKAAFLAFGSGVSAFVQLGISAVLARTLTPAGYGTYKQTYLIYNIALPLLSLGLPAALLYFLPRAKERGRGVLTEALLVLGVAGALFSTFLLFVGADLIAKHFSNPALATTLRWFAIVPAVSLPLSAVSSALVASNRPTWVAGFAVCQSLTRLVLVLAPIFLIARTPLAAIQGSSVAALLLFVPGIYLMYRAVGVGDMTPQANAVYTALCYSVPLGVGAMIGTIHKITDKYIISTMVPPEEAAVFFNGAMEIPFISLLTGSVAAIMVPELAKLYQAGDTDGAIALFKRGAIKCGAILAPLAGWFFVSAPWIMLFIYGSGFVKSTPIFRVYLLMVPLRVAFFGPLFQAGGRSDLVLSRSIIGFIGNIVLTIIGAKLFGPIGAAIGTVLSILLFAYAFCIVASAKLYRTPVRDLLPLRALARQFVPIIIIVSVMMLFASQLELEKTLVIWHWIIMSVLYLVAVLGCYMALGVVTPEQLRLRAEGIIGSLRSRLSK